MEFFILGPLEVRSAQGPIVVPGAKQRAILAALLLSPGEVVSVDRLLEAVWGEHQPANPKNALQSQISALRRRFGEAAAGVLAVRASGYVLQVDAADVDTGRFERAVRDGRAAIREGDYARAGRELRAALALWRGSPLPEVAGLPFADAAISRLEELRLGAVEDRIDCDLHTGRHRELIPDLEALVADHPLRERLRGQLMLALARAGRQADALGVFHDTRQVLGEELGIDPSRELVRIYETLLRQEDETPWGVTDPAPMSDRGPAVSMPTVGSLPRPFSSFVGRDDDLERVLDLLADARLLTLTGPGGVGKTRLATEAVRSAVDAGHAPDGAWLVELANLQEPSLLWHTVAETLGISEGPGMSAGGSAPDTRARVTAALHDRDALLLLDNGEHLIDAVASFVRTLLSTTTALTILCTSREALGVTGETVWSVSSLSLPPEALDGPPAGLLRWGAVELFIDRARSADPDLRLDASTAPHIVEVCRRLDGIPLALELAAARVRTLGLAELTARLDDRFQLLTGGDRTLQPRQRTLRAVIEWSWELLGESERALFRRLSVFAGTATPAAIEAVCADDRQLPRDGILTVASSLVDKSVIVVERQTRPLRYRMLETLRVYAAGQLAASDERRETEDRHTRYVLASVKELVPRLRGPRQLDAMQELDAQLDDIRAVLRRLAATADRVEGARLATDLGWYWYLRGRRTEGLRALATFADGAAPREAALSTLWSGFLDPSAAPSAGSGDVEAAVATLAVHGSLHDQTFAELIASLITSALGDRERSLAHLAVARGLSERTGDPADAALVELATGNGSLAVGDVFEARGSLTIALDRFEALEDRWGQVQCLTGLLTCAEVTGDLEAAQVLADRGISLSVDLRLVEMEAILRCRRAILAIFAQRFDLAAREIATARRLADDLGSEVMARNADLAAGFLALRAGDLDAAEHHLERVRAWLADSPYPAMRVITLLRLGTVAELRGELEMAAALHRDCYADAQTLGDPRSMALAMEGLAGAHAADGRAEDAALLLGAAQTLRASVGLVLPEYERPDVARAEAAARASLGAAAFDEALARGRTLSPDRLPLE